MQTLIAKTLIFSAAVSTTVIVSSTAVASEPPFKENTKSQDLDKKHSTENSTSIGNETSNIVETPVLESFLIQDIKIQGIERVEPGTIFNYLPLKVGDTFTHESGDRAIRELFATGFFKDVRLQNLDNTLIVLVKEQPSISKIEFIGTKAFDKENLKKALLSQGVAEARFYNTTVIEQAKQELKRQYVARGYYAAEVKTTVIPIERNRVAIAFIVMEGAIAKINSINFIGNIIFSTSELRNEMQLATPNWLSWYTKNDQYSKQKLTADLESLHSFYLDRGYLEFKIESAQVSITPNKQDIALTVHVKEGARFTVSNVELSGELLSKKTELLSKLTLKSGDIFSASKLTASTKAITDTLGAYGYAFATVIPKPTMDYATNKVNINLLIEPGKRVYVRNINIVGNYRTRDNVIRREMRQYESSWLDSDRLRLSRERINRTGYFGDANISIEDIPGVPDQADVKVTVVEKPTGSINVGAGYSSTEKITFTGSIQQENLFGSGTSLGLSVGTGHVNRTFAITQYDPYFTKDGVSRILDLYYRTSQPYYYIGDNDYKLISKGAAIKLGIPFSEEDKVFFGIGIEKNHLSLSENNSPPNLLKFVQDYGTNTTDMPFTIGWSRDNRDSVLVPTKGRYQQADFKIGVPSAKLRYYEFSYQNQYYFPIRKGYTLAFNTEISYGHGYGGKPFPVTKNVFIGGIGSVRGYEANTLGPSAKNKKNENIPLGGTSKLIANMEFYVPLPGSGIDRTVRLFAFIDGGAVYQEKQNYNLKDLRFSYGVGLSWISPIGPLKLSYGFPINKKADDKIQRFQFQIGTAF